MKTQNTRWRRVLPYLLGALLFFIGAARFFLQEDIVGAVIFTLSGLLAVFMAYLTASRQGPSAS